MVFSLQCRMKILRYTVQCTIVDYTVCRREKHTCLHLSMRIKWAVSRDFQTRHVFEHGSGFRDETVGLHKCPSAPCISILPDPGRQTNQIVSLFSVCSQHSQSVANIPSLQPTFAVCSQHSQSVANILSLQPTFSVCSQHSQSVANILSLQPTFTVCSQHSESVANILSLQPTFGVCSQHSQFVANILSLQPTFAVCSQHSW